MEIKLWQKYNKDERRIKMTKVYIKDKRLWKDEKPISLVSGEVHY